MKIHRAVLFFCLAGVCFLADYPVYGSPLKSDNEQMELCLEKLQVNIAEEEKAIESLKKRYEDILREKQNSEAQTVKKENKELDALQSEKNAAELKLKSFESQHQSLQQKNEELSNSLKQSFASLREKNKVIEELKKSGSQPKKEVSGRQSSRKDNHSAEDALARKELDKLQKEKISLENQLKALKEERKNRPARDTAQLEPRAGKAGNGARKEEIKENSFPGESIDSKNSKKQRPPCFEVSRENKPGILKDFLDKARKIDSLWREKVW